ncbi:MAG: bifunctional DNA-formamidopyrimidine glycosylase/DNA-(apurinic or apyrimidinic site) lyase [Neisseria sp.]|nr:bifunctional DNA-formamidopyrimidine glycosylase/DNA-(apurinic or apyrimidinic site) lyase [Neisseria sp.]
MPELPEVETVLRGISPRITGKTVAQTIIRQAKLRRPIPPGLPQILAGQTVLECSRRAKYLIIRFAGGILLIHLGMTGNLRIYQGHNPPPQKHDHFDLLFSDGTLMRYRDPRRFGMILWYAGIPETHPLLQNLAPEPLGREFTAVYLYSALQRRKSPVKAVLMDNKAVVGVGNIYANESLFAAGIDPARPARQITEKEAAKLVHEIRRILRSAIEKGGSTLRDFADSEGNSGYFQQEYAVYGRCGLPCPQCGGPVEKTLIGQRSSFYCPRCQK